MTTPTKGMRAYQEIINYFLTVDRMRGATYGELALKYKLDRNNVEARIINYLYGHRDRSIIRVRSKRV